MMRGVETQASLDDKALYVEGIMGKVGTPEELGELRVSGGLYPPIKLSEIVTTTPGFVMEPTYINRVDNYRAATITGTITAKDVGSVNQAAQEKINALAKEYPDVKFRIGGVFEEMQGAFEDMLIAVLIAIVIAYAIVVIFFRSFLTPLIIMFSLPLASIDALLALLITGRTLDISALMGMLMLVGIVLSNAILLVALVEQLRKGGMSTFDALVQGGRTRLRPILMTALATMFALVPLSLGLEQGVLLAASLGTVVIGGLFTSTLLTLVVIPVIYSLVEGLRRRRPAS
jgi:HAE1 family hydrophobic/amphiphilic exporter-1